MTLTFESRLWKLIGVILLYITSIFTKFDDPNQTDSVYILFTRFNSNV